MSTWVIGDVQGALEPLERLLEALDYASGRDRIVLAGDLVNRGPDSAGVLRWAAGEGEAVTAVLGNHDVHLLACAEDPSQIRKKDTLGDVLSAPDRDRLVTWLAERPFWIDLPGHIVVHAAVHPAWTLDEGRALAAECSAALAGSDGSKILSTWRTGTGRWDPGADPIPRATTTLAALTRMRCVTSDHTQDFTYSGPLVGLPQGLTPWFRARSREADDPTICFGHWARMGHRIEPGYVALDSGAVYGRELTAYRIDDGRIVQVPGLTHLPE